jgi:hypothetical protein
MQNHGKFITKSIFLLLLTFQFLWAASVEATLSNTEVVQGNVVQLRIKATGDKALFPDIQKIGDAKVLGKHQGQNNSITYINGKMSSERTISLVLTFAPQHDMTIPSYSVNIDGTVYKTDPINLKVVQANAPKMAATHKFSLLMRTDKKSVIVGEPLVATVFFSLQNGVRLSDNPQYSKPEFKGFFVKEIGSEKSYRDGNRQVTELRYLLIPQSEGNFTLDQATAKIGVADRSRRDMFGRFFGTNWTDIASNTVNIEVKPKPEDTDLVGSFSIENSIDKQSVKENKPVNLTVKITGEGSLEDFEFPEYEIDGVTIYSDNAKVETHVVNNTLKSTYVKSFAFISDHDFTIPARIISVYDIKKGAVNNLKIPAYEVKVEAEKVFTSVSDKVATGIVQTNLKQEKNSQERVIEKNVEVTHVSWWMLAIAFVSGLLVMYILRYIPIIKWKREKSPFKESEALKILYAHINESKETEQMVRKLYAKKNGDKSVIIDKKELKELVERYRDH